MYRFALRPWWIVSHIFVLTLIVVMINLGFWQLRRLDEKQAINAQIEERSGGEPIPIDAVVSPDDPVSVGEGVEWENVTASGRYDEEGQVLVRSRSRDGRPGFWVLTPLTDDSTSVAVLRGWVPFLEETDGSDVEISTPTGEVAATGLVQRSYSPPKPAGDEIITVAHADLEWLDEQVAADLYPVAIQLETQDPAQTGDYPVALGPPDLTEGPHLGYAAQWFIFSIIAIVGYPIILRKVALQKQREKRAEVQPVDDGTGTATAGKGPRLVEEARPAGAGPGTSNA